MPGANYQINLEILLLVNLYLRYKKEKNNYNVSLECPQNEAGKFDDIRLELKSEKEGFKIERIICFQAKRYSNIKLSENNLFNNNNQSYDLKKYFDSFKDIDIEERKKIVNVILLTNVNFDSGPIINCFDKTEFKEYDLFKPDDMNIYRLNKSEEFANFFLDNNVDNDLRHEFYDKFGIITNFQNDDKHLIDRIEKSGIKEHFKNLNIRNFVNDVRQLISNKCKKINEKKTHELLKKNSN